MKYKKHYSHSSRRKYETVREKNGQRCTRSARENKHCFQKVKDLNKWRNTTGSEVEEPVLLRYQVPHNSKGFEKPNNLEKMKK